jgi:lipoate-protein ligase A
MSSNLKILRYEDVDPAQNPTGESLLSRTEKPFKIWTPDSKWLILGNSQEPAKELRVPEVLRDRIPVYKRRSGGGAVLLSPGCLCLGLRFAKRKEFNLHDYFRLGSGHVQDVILNTLGIALEPKGISDLVNGDRKVAGCALYMPRDYALYLVSVLVDPNFADIDTYLAHPSKEPDYRARRSHTEFLVGLTSLGKKPTKAEVLALQFERDTPVQLKNFLDWNTA